MWPVYTCVVWSRDLLSLIGLITLTQISVTLTKPLARSLYNYVYAKYGIAEAPPAPRAGGVPQKSTHSQPQRGDIPYQVINVRPC